MRLLRGETWLNWSRTFDGPLPDTLAEFLREVHTDFPIVIDTKFLATCEGPSSTGISTRLQNLWETFSILRCPTISEPTPGV